MPIQTSSPTLTIPVSPLTTTSFAEFGEVIENPSTHDNDGSVQSVMANQGSATKYLNPSHLINHYNLSTSGKAASSVFNMFVCKPRQLEQKRASGQRIFPVRILERHPFTPQTFIPMGLDKEDQNTAYLVIVAPTLPLTQAMRDSYSPPYPNPAPHRKRSLRERLLGARPNPFTNDFLSRTTPEMPASPSPASTRPKGPGLPDLNNVRAFIARGDQAVTYGPGTWHAPMVVLGQKAVEFVVVQYANGVAAEDCQEVELVVEEGENGLEVNIQEGLMSIDMLDVKAKL